MDAEKQYELFISYAQADSAWVEGYLLDFLKSAGVSWYSEEAFYVGAPRILEFENTLQKSKRIILVLTPAYMAENVNPFFDVLVQSYGAETGTWPVIPLILKSVKLPPRLSQLVSLDASNPKNWDKVQKRLLADLQKKSEISISSPECPYLGMVSFSEKNSEYFFGRDSEIEYILMQLRLHPFQAVIGASGSGKSSLVFAGLIPALKNSGFFGVGVCWNIQAHRPSKSLLSILSELELTKAVDYTYILLVIDQFEEIFSLQKNERKELQKKLLQIIGKKNVYLVITARADFYPELMTSIIWSEIQENRLEVVPLDEKGLYQAITRPAEIKNVYLESSLVERLIADAAGEPGILPFIQETLVLLWEKLERRFLPLRAYEALVIPRVAYGESPITGLQVALTLRAENTYSKLTNEQKKMTRWIFLRLIQFGEGRAHTRRQQPLHNLNITGGQELLFATTVNHLSDNRLLTLTAKEEDTEYKIDISHEALIQGWSRLGKWVVEYQSIEQERRYLFKQAKRWLQLEKKGGLLDKTELIKANEWVKRAILVGMDVDKEIYGFLKKSVHLISRQKKVQWLRSGAVLFFVITSVLVGLYAYRYYLKYQALEDSPVELVAGGNAIIGTNNIDADDMEKPQHIVNIASFKIERFEVSNHNYQLCVQAKICDIPDMELDRYLALEFRNHPVVGVTPVHAQTYCQWLGRRLPTNVEWEVSARGKTGMSWPWGDSNPKEGDAQMPIEIPSLQGTVSVNQKLMNKLSAGGVFHQVGNVWEWVIRVKKGCQNEECQIIWNKKTPNVAIMGGSYDSSIQGITELILPGIEVSDPAFGFRCVLH